ncbi:NAD(P)-binding domain protein [Metarhizium album ARSEF 1941]|uniref:Hydroxynaphthalene reductase-like protein Arp2 n=1 Tax=Metarhizium album (strain ARSEF 1941) TaxID=1081103 RepID=A0A0B2WEW7_METAS|nr:NAD(P)-binding domain protein [Metarhizium album ARSEF 1941]KHN94421.1 NAD(P)-binding domain protein [Metarhizium album ARSEF 1941]
MADQITQGPGPRADQKVALVTGAGAGGIGGALATELHAAGYFVICAVRRLGAASELLKPGIVAVELDVSSTASVSAAARSVAAMANDELHVLVNNAGSATHRPALDLDVDGVVASMFDVNVLGVMRVVKAFSRLLVNAKGGGCIVNIGSVAPIVPLAYSSAYNATKAALHAYGDSLRMELKPFGCVGFPWARHVEFLSASPLTTDRPRRAGSTS